MEFLQHGLDLAADDRLQRAAHAGIALVGGAPGQHALVGGGHMGVRADDGGDFAVEVPAHGHFFTGGLGVEVHEDDGCIEPHPLNLAGDDGEGVLELVAHEDAALEIDDADFAALLCLQNQAALAGRALGVVQRPQHTRLLGKEGDDLLLIPDVVAGGDDGRPGAHEPDGDLRRDAAASS